MTEDSCEGRRSLKLKIPVIKSESETQTSGHLISKYPEILKSSKIEKEYEMESTQQSQNMSLKKRRNLSKNRGTTARQREKTPEPSRSHIVHEDTTTSDDDDIKPKKSISELEADNTYEEMKRLVEEKAKDKDPVYDLDIDEVLEARAMAANERRRRSISPFALPDKEEMCKLQRKGSFIDPTNKLLSTNYNLSLKDEESGRRRSLTIETQSMNTSTTPSTPVSISPKDKGLPFKIPTTPKIQDKIIYSDESENTSEEKPSKQLKTPVTKENVFTFEGHNTTPNRKQPPNIPDTPISPGEQIAKVNSTNSNIKQSPKIPDTPVSSGELVTKVIQIERTPSKKLYEENKPNVEIRERIVRTPSKKITAEAKPIVKQQIVKKTKEEATSKAPPVKPARSKSNSRLGGRTSESEMSEDQSNTNYTKVTASRRKAFPTPRRFLKTNASRPNRSQSVNRADEMKVVDKTDTVMSQTSKEILELMQKARARSLSITKDDPKLPIEYIESRNLQTPNKSPVGRRSRGISCPKTIQIISDKEILSGLFKNENVVKAETEQSRKSSGYIDASQSEYTSSCYSTSPSDNEYKFDLSEKTDELTHKLQLLSEQADKKYLLSKINLTPADPRPENVLRKRSIHNVRTELKKEYQMANEANKSKLLEKEVEKPVKFQFQFLVNWQQFKRDHINEYNKILIIRNKCICHLLLLIIMCGLGGIMFKGLEGSFENAYKCSTRNVKRDFIEILWKGSHYLREEDWKSMARKKLYEFEDQLHTAHEAGITSYSGQRSWNFMNSFVYCLTLVTTIGYGHIAPKTTYGRVATIVYAIIGIPLFLIILADFGKLFTRIIKFFWAFIRRFYYTRSCRKVRRTAPVQEVMKGLNIMYDAVRRPSQIFSEEDLQIRPHGDNDPESDRKSNDAPPPLPPKPGSMTMPDFENDPETPAPSVYEIDDEFNLPISVAIFILVVYIIIGAAVYHMWETWDFFESFYFVFISMSTIGLGDLVPDHPMFMMASILYLVFGLALTSMCINVVQIKLSDTFKQASAKLGATIGLKVAEEDGSLVPVTPPPTEIVPVHKPKVEKNDNHKTPDEILLKDR